ncbi:MULTISPECIES: AI-2E family transporter [unclassified Pantoea]|uniref:AI-2E family transporter n=1 Tax=unclassified Pantoea TaxID=2630326 RepID=UPI001232DF98|nr:MULTISPECIES: AI-2E family transporter [unclassified Pantoea]KAA5974526.1 AI-2E family transporter [Pantoea sp. M_6]KAA5978212.1 AI-2E family transporter [Pantoea sp. M_8]KAA5990034.1 AI-2E family transporter [Pantoea sp. M_10]KAA6002743.1 AI-2E family transporter [Pantoea sp. M_5]
MGLRWFTPGSPLARVLFMLACLTLILTGLYLAAPLINQVLLAMLLAIMLDPLITRLDKKHIPRIVSSLLVISLMLFIMVITTLKLSVLTPDLMQLSRQAPVLLAARLDQLTLAFARLDIAVTPDRLLAFVDAGAIVRIVTAFLTQIPGVISWWIMVFLMLLFMLYEMPLLKNALQRRMQGEQRAFYLALHEGIQSVIVYARVKTLTSILGGVIVGAGAHLIGLKFAFFWGVLMFIFNYVPVLGSFLAAIPPVIQSYLLFDLQVALAVALFFVVLNLCLSSVIEPLLIGKRLNLALTTQLLAFLFWQSLLGITGGILAIPLTFLIKKVLLASYPRQDPISELTQ